MMPVFSDDDYDDDVYQEDPLLKLEDDHFNHEDGVTQPYTAFNQGHLAGEEEIERSLNPYDFGSIEEEFWWAGYDLARRDAGDDVEVNEDIVRAIADQPCHCEQCTADRARANAKRSSLWQNCLDAFCNWRTVRVFSACLSMSMGIKMMPIESIVAGILVGLSVVLIIHEKKF